MVGREWGVVLVAGLLAGCSDIDQALNTERKVATPPGIASVDDIEDVQRATGGVSPAADPAPPATPASSSPGPAGATASPGPAVTAIAGAQQPQPDDAPRQTFIGKTTARVLDYKRHRNDPFVVIVENKIEGRDPLSIAASGYVSATSRASVNNFKHQLDIIKATDGRYPTFKEYTDLSKKLRINFAKLPRYQAYGYDEDKGAMYVLEDKREKIRIYRKAGIPLDAADQVFADRLEQQQKKKGQ